MSKTKWKLFLWPIFQFLLHYFEYSWYLLGLISSLRLVRSRKLRGLPCNQIEMRIFTLSRISFVSSGWTVKLIHLGDMLFYKLSLLSQILQFYLTLNVFCYIFTNVIFGVGPNKFWLFQFHWWKVVESWQALPICRTEINLPTLRKLLSIRAQNWHWLAVCMWD